jgi:uroporphyrin-III C-methyltransferase
MVNASDSSSAAAGPSTPRAFPTPTRGAALPLTFRPRDQVALVVGSNRLAAVRAFSLLEADASVLVTSREPLESAHEELQYRVAAGEVRYIQSNPPDAGAWQAFLDQQEVSLVAVTDTLIGSSRRSNSSAEDIAAAARKLRVPINVSDLPNLSSFTFPSVHRFPGESGPSTLQVAVSTNGHGCRLAGRIRRDIATRLPSSVGAAVENVGKLRARAMSLSLPEEERRDISEDDVEMPLNTPVPQLGASVAGAECVTSDRDAPEAGTSGDVADAAEARLRRMRWVHQMSEYYSYDALSRLTPSTMDEALSTYSITSPPPALLPHHEGSTATTRQQGRIYLVGSGPGHPGLLTVAALHVLRTATLILSDKLVPAEVLALIPKSTTLHIAKKFPGNAEGAQNEMMELALAGAQKGEVVVRLKQGDPFVYGRGGEEVLYFREHGFESTVIPGVSSALAGPLMMGIPVTQRGVAESLILCTGVGRQGRAVQLPGYIKSRTLLVLMGVARIASIVDVLTSATSQGRDGTAYPRQLPIAVVERASSPDQRVVLSTLEHIEEALRSMEERPPGMMVIGWAALALEGKGRVDVLDGADEAQVVQEWLGGEAWKVREGLSDEWNELLGSVEV